MSPESASMVERNPATTAFCLLGGLGGGVFATEPGLLSHAGLTFIAVGAIAGGLLGRGCWRAVAASHDRWNPPVRGALAGGFTGLLWLSPFMMTVFMVERYSSATGFLGAFTSLDAVLEFVAGFVVFGAYGVFLIGWATVPIGVLTGYLVGRTSTENAGTDDGA